MYPLERVIALFEAVDAHAEQIMQAEVVAVDEEDDEPINSPIFQYLSANNAFDTFTHLTADKIEAIWRPVNAIMAAQRHRGPIPSSTPMDHILLYLVWLRTGQDYATIAKIFKMSEFRLEDDLNRVRGPLLHSLEEKWWNPRRRPPREDLTSIIPRVGLIVDGHTTEIPTPKMRASLMQWCSMTARMEFMVLQKQVAIHASPPSFLHVCAHVPGSIHDYELHKEVYRNYVEYLHMTPVEIARQEEVIELPYWPIMGDKAYIGPSNDTEHIKRIVPTRGGLLSQQQRGRNRVIDSKNSSASPREILHTPFWNGPSS